jgi:hypothetical protein
MADTTRQSSSGNALFTTKYNIVGVMKRVIRGAVKP